MTYGGSFSARSIRPAEETGTGQPRVEAVYGYIVGHPRGVLLLDTGLGAGDPETEDWYRPQRIELADALGAAGMRLPDIDVVVNCHLHFDHCGGNPRLAGTPVVCQRNELAIAQRGDYTMEHLIDYPGSTYDLLDGEAELWPGIHVIPTPGHVDGHQSVVVECDDGSLVLAGQSHDTASSGAADCAGRPSRARSVTTHRCRLLPHGWNACWRSIRARVVFALDVMRSGRRWRESGQPPNACVAVTPPSTAISAPLMYDDSSEARKT